ncbi:MAG: hypothetical protein P4L46_17955, partial [Fimbriimonas sp.]|nr:hypothetical protein [Fimbriimonas sp.]
MTFALLCFALLHPGAADQVQIDKGRIKLSVSTATGRFSVAWGHQAEIDDAYGEAKLPDGSFLATDSFPVHDISRAKIRDSFGSGEQFVVTHSGGPTPIVLKQTFSIYRGRAEVIVGLDLVGSPSGTNQIAPIVSKQPIKLRHAGPLQSLFVPYDNDSYFRYSSSAWDKKEGSFEVGSLYDDASRGGLVVGSIDHDVWKSAVQFERDGGLRAYAGVTGTFTHDQEPHGTVTGKEVKSPRFVLGLYPDWRTGLERFGDLNAIVQPKLPWSGSVPFGWNSWSGYMNKVNLEAMDGALSFVKKDLPWFRSGGIAYLNFDSFWDNLTRPQRVEYVKRVHAAGLKAGVYWTPFVNWGEPDWKTVGGYTFRDLQMKDAKGVLLPKLDGGWPLDPTHPGTLQRIDETLKDFVDQGFDYVKLDFLTHGALEGRHFIPSVQTGTAAYRVAMQRIVEDLSPKKVGRPFFISLSIAPLFPHGYAHSRRISCDVFSNIGASEYFLNSQNYAWWEANRLYRYNDPDSACEYRALGEKPTTLAEARTRFTASVIGGGMMIEGDTLTDPQARARVLNIFSNRSALDLARRTPQFRPVFGDTGDKAGDAFIYRDRDGIAYLAAFNYNKSASKTLDLSLARLGLL